MMLEEAEEDTGEAQYQKPVVLLKKQNIPWKG